MTVRSPHVGSAGVLALASAFALGMLGIGGPAQAQELFNDATAASGLGGFVPTVNPATAPREVLLALTGADSVAVDGILAARERRGRAADAVPGVPAVYLDRFEATEVRRVTITSVGTTASGARFVRQAIVGLEESGRSDNPYRILAWTQRFD